MDARFTASRTRVMESTDGDENTHAQPPQPAQTSPCHRGCHSRDISTQQRSIIVSDGSNFTCIVGLHSSFILPGLVSMGAQRVERSRPSFARPSLASVAATSRSKHVEPTVIPNTVGVGTCPLEQVTQTGSSANIGANLSPRRRTAKRRCLPETFPASSLNPQLRNRRVQHYGHFDRSRDREQSFLESSAVRPSARKTYHETVETFRLWASLAGISLETVPKLDQALVWYLNEKFFDGEAVAHEWAHEGDLPRRAGVSRLLVPCLEVILLIDEMVRLEKLVAVQATALIFALCLRPSDTLHLCQEQVVPPRCEWQATSGFGAFFCTSQSGA